MNLSLQGFSCQKFHLYFDYITLDIFLSHTYASVRLLEHLYHN